jgi:hypothetical protein
LHRTRYKQRPLWHRSSHHLSFSLLPLQNSSLKPYSRSGGRSVDMPDQYMGQIHVGLGQPGPSTSTAAKRPFQDLDTEGEETRDSSSSRSSASGSSPNKRARSEGSPSTEAGSSSTSTLSSSSPSHLPIQPPAEFNVPPTETLPDSRPHPPTLPSPTHLLTASNHLSMPPIPPMVDMHHSPVLPAPYPSTSAHSTLSHPPVPSTSINSFEATLQRAHDFELQIAAIREDISNPGAPPTEHFPPTERSRHSHSPLAPRASHDSDLPSVEQFLNDIRNRSPPLNAMQTFAARRERLLSTLSLLRRERRERPTGEREETSRTRSPPVHGFYPPEVPRSPQLPQFLQVYEHILNDHIANTMEDDYLPFNPFYIGHPSAVDPEPAPLPLELERELVEGVFLTAIIIRNCN